MGGLFFGKSGTQLFLLFPYFRLHIPVNCRWRSIRLQKENNGNNPKKWARKRCSLFTTPLVQEKRLLLHQTEQRSGSESWNGRMHATKVQVYSGHRWECIQSKIPNSGLRKFLFTPIRHIFHVVSRIPKARGKKQSIIWYSPCEKQVKVCDSSERHGGSFSGLQDYARASGMGSFGPMQLHQKV